MPAQEDSDALTPRTRNEKLTSMSKEEIKATLLAESRKRVLAGIARRKSVDFVSATAQSPRQGSPSKEVGDEISEPGSPSRVSVEGQIERALKRKKDRATSGEGGAACMAVFDRLDIHKVSNCHFFHEFAVLANL